MLEIALSPGTSLDEAHDQLKRGAEKHGTICFTKFNGLEIKSVLDLAKPLKSGNYEEAERLFYEQGHSGMSGSLVLIMVREFCENGVEFGQGMR